MSDELVVAMDRILSLSGDGPKELEKLRAAAETLDDRSYGFSQDEVALAIVAEGWGGPLHALLKRHLTRWDYAAEVGWADQTEPNTRARRDLVYRLLGVDDKLAAVLEEWLPHYEAPVLIKVVDQPPTGWYTSATQAARNFYWSAFSEHLRTGGWPEESINDLDESTFAVMERLAEPTEAEARPKRGLVAGYVQSGKTANITGVIAKAADAGYRLIIVLSGNTKLLRAQTQRRLDQELLGKELIRPEGTPDEDTDYLDDADWDTGFVSHGDLPSRLGAFDFARLTGYREDYRRIRTGLEFELREPQRPLYDPVNVHAARARIMVVKKNAAVLKRVASDLARIRPSADQVPALIIDDESDQASVNTARPSTASERKKRTRINERIVDMLKALPRGQYIGYTATPFANVFIDPSDFEDLFPSDFLIGLKRPLDYMGAKDFHDLSPLPDGAKDDPSISNERAFIRSVRGEDLEPQNLLAAIDAYVLSGAIKLYRQSRGEASYRHHTMLLHSSQRTADHEALRDRAVKLLAGAGYDGGAGMRRLQRLLEDDFSAVSLGRPAAAPLKRDQELSSPGSIDELRAHIGEMLQRLREDRPVLIVNGTDQADDPDFDKQPVWKILVGGAKLSRGYTIEGLTVSYFRRRAGAADTLMQMGRWFGFRKGYRDLVRVYIGRQERVGRTDIDLYEAFEGVCRDEEEFRAQLARYSMPEDGSPPLTPKQIPPLVHSHLPWLPPVAGNKRYNAVIREMDFRGKWSEPTLAPTEKEENKLRRNLDRFATLLAEVDLSVGDLSTGQETARCIYGIAKNGAVLDLFRSYEWAGTLKPIQLQIEYLSGGGEVRAEVDDWVIVAPQLKRGAQAGWHWHAVTQRFDVKRRSRLGDRIKAYSEPEHRAIAEHITGLTRAAVPNVQLDELARPKRGVVLFYPVWTEDRVPDPFHPIAGFAILFPGESQGSRIVWQVHDLAKPHAPVVDAD
jgi:hypothetical protein